MNDALKETTEQPTEEPVDDQPQAETEVAEDLEATPEQPAEETAEQSETAEAVENADADEASPDETAAEEEPATPTKSVADLEHEHYEQIRAKEHEVREARLEFQDAKTVASQLKKRSDRLDEELCDLIAQDPRQHRMQFTDPEPAAEGSSAKPTKVSEKDLYRTESVYVLSLPVSLTEKLVDGGLGTLGELQDHWQSRKPLTDITGIGEELAAKVADAFADYGQKHPEMFDPVEDAEETELEETDEAEVSAEDEAATDEQAMDEPTPAEADEPEAEPVDEPVA